MLGSESEIQLQEGLGEVIFDPVCIKAKAIALIFIFASWTSQYWVGNTRIYKVHQSMLNSKQLVF